MLGVREYRTKSISTLLNRIWTGNSFDVSFQILIRWLNNLQWATFQVLRAHNFLKGRAGSIHSKHTVYGKQAKNTVVSKQDKDTVSGCWILLFCWSWLSCNKKQLYQPFFFFTFKNDANSPYQHCRTAIAQDQNQFRKKGMKGTIGTEGVVVVQVLLWVNWQIAEEIIEVGMFFVEFCAHTIFATVYKLPNMDYMKTL